MLFLLLLKSFLTSSSWSPPLVAFFPSLLPFTGSLFSCFTHSLLSCLSLLLLSSYWLSVPFLPTHFLPLCSTDFPFLFFLVLFYSNYILIIYASSPYLYTVFSSAFFFATWFSSSPPTSCYSCLLLLLYVFLQLWSLYCFIWL